MKSKLLMILLASGLTMSAAHAEQNMYVSLKLGSMSQSLASATLTSPRVTNRVEEPQTNRRFGGSFAIGYHLSENWRLEAEYTAKSRSEFKTRWAPFDANINSLQTSSHRLMVNGYKDFPLSDKFSVYGTLGAGLAKVMAAGYQGTTNRQFDNKSQTKFAYSLGVGAEYKLTKTVSAGLGYRFIDMGKISTGDNKFANRINARDEQLQGKLFEHEILASLRVSF